MLRAWRKQQQEERLALGEAWPNTDIVFTDELGEPVHPERIGKTFTRLTKIAGLRHTRLHDLRHGAASLLLNSGADMFLVSRILGHADISTTTKIYGHLDPRVAATMADVAAARVPRKAVQG